MSKIFNDIKSILAISNGIENRGFSQDPTCGSFQKVCTRQNLFD